MPAATQNNHNAESVPILDSETVRIIAESWDVVKRNGDVDRLGAVHFQKFLALTGDAARKLYVQTDMGRQAHVVTPVVEWLVENPDEQALVAIALYHAHLGVSPQQLKAFADCFTEAVLEVLPQESLTDEVRHAWTDAMDALQSNIAARLARYVKSLDSIKASADGAATRPSAFEGATPSVSPVSAAGAAGGDPSLQSGKTIDVTSPVEGNSPQTAAKVMCRMRAKAGCSQLSRLARPEREGWLRLSTYAQHRIKAPESDAQHLMHLFRNRYVELKGQYLYYATSQEGRPDGIIDVCHCELIDTSIAASPLPSPSPFSFALRDHASLAYPYYFICSGDEEKETWFVALRKACNRFSFIRSDLYAGQKVVIVGTIDGVVPTPSKPGKITETYGTCRWTGRYGTHQDLWVGVELDEPTACGHDGTVNGRAYFRCEPGCGVIVPAHLVSAASPLEIQVRGGPDAAPLRMDYTPRQFEFLALLGRGSFGRVCKVRERATGKIFAVKILQKAALLRESQITNVRREKSILLNISHPFIVKLHAAFQSKGRLFLLFDFLSGGELFTHIQGSRKGHLDETAAQFYIAEVALAISYLHSMSIVHRDLKAENLVLDRQGHVVLTDFGFAKTVLDNEHNTTRCGTLPYMAPEILRQTVDGYGLAVDWWSMGVLLFLVTTGYYPFYDQDAKETAKQILTRKITMTTFPPSPVLSETCRALILSLIRKDPSKRMQTIDALKAHPWYAGFDWTACYERRLVPPFVPDPAGKNTKYFDMHEKHIQGHSAPLPKGWSKDYAFASFQDVHAVYKPYEDPSNLVSSDEEDDLYDGLHHLEPCESDEGLTHSASNNADASTRTYAPFVLRT